MKKLTDIEWHTWVPAEHAVLCYIRNNGHVLLMRKKRGLGAGKINAPGGRIERGETPLKAAVRETEEEVCVRPSGMVYAGDLFFQFTDGYSLRGYVFLGTGYSGIPAETEEADPFWCPLEEIPYDKMWADDKIWLPEMLNGGFISGRFIFDGDTMLDSKVETEILRPERKALCSGFMKNQ